MSWPVWRVAPEQAALLTEGQLIGAAIVTIIGLPALGFAGIAAVNALFQVRPALDGPFALVGQTFALLVFSIVGSWFYFIVAVPLVSMALRTGRIGFAPTAIAGGCIGFTVTFILVQFLPVGFGERFAMALFTGCFGVGFSLVFWMLVRMINPRAFAPCGISGTTQADSTGTLVQ